MKIINYSFKFIKIYIIAISVQCGLVFCQSSSSSARTCPDVTTMKEFKPAQYAGVWYLNLLFHTVEKANRRCDTVTYNFQEGAKTLNFTVKDSTRSFDGYIQLPENVEEAANYTAITPSYSASVPYWIVNTDYTTYAVVAGCTPGRSRSVRWISILTRERNPQQQVVQTARTEARKANLTGKYRLTTVKQNRLSKAMLSTIMIVAISGIAISMTGSLGMPTDPFPMMLDVYGRPYPQRAVMFAGFYRPLRPMDNRQESGVYTHGNEMSARSYLREVHLGYLKPSQSVKPTQADVTATSDDVPESEEIADFNKHQLLQHSDQTHFLPEESPLSNIPQPTKPLKPKNKKDTKLPRPVEEEDDNDDDDDDDDVDEEYEDEKDFDDAPFTVTKNKRRGQSPNLNNFFPMIFSFPGSISRRRGESESGFPPGVVTAIANSYSTGKGGVASSVATAYGGSPFFRPSIRMGNSLNYGLFTMKDLIPQGRLRACALRFHYSLGKESVTSGVEVGAFLI